MNPHTFHQLSIHKNQDIIRSKYVLLGSYNLTNSTGSSNCQLFLLKIPVVMVYGSFI